MNNGLVRVGTVLSVLCWSGYAPAGPGAAEARGERAGVPAAGAPGPARAPEPARVLPQSREGGSEVPCDAPLRWRVARVDPEFGLSVAEATAVVARAAEMWQRSADAPLFLHDPEQGFPIRLVFDERQARTRERLRLEADLAERSAALERERAELQARSAEWDRAVEAHGYAVRAYQGRLARHNEQVRDWNRRGGAPPDVAREFEEVARALAEESARLEAAEGSLRARRDRMVAASEALEGRFEALAAEGDRLARAFPPLAVQSGVYREIVRRENGAVASVGREIRIHRFSDRNELRAVTAHELGHALGLGHTAASGAVMSAEGEEGRAPATLGRADERLLRTVCPGLAGPGARGDARGGRPGSAGRRGSPEGDRGISPVFPSDSRGAGR